MFIRFISHIFKLGYEPCKSCEMFQEQLRIERAENKELMTTLLDMVKPKVHEVSSTPIAPVTPKAMPWAMRRRALEEVSRQEARIIAESTVMERGKSVEELEKELGVEDASQDRKTV